MIVPNPDLIVHEARARRQQLIDEAEHYRQRQGQRTAGPPLLRGVGRQIGNWLIAAGRRLGADVPAMPSESVPTVS